jgi:large subunit ribosomal protein L10
MRAEKQLISKEYFERLNQVPFFIVADYQGLKVSHFAELRRRLSKAGAEMHVVKNSIFKIAAKSAGIEDLGAGMAGQLAVITGKQDVSVTAKVLKTFRSEFDKPKVRFGWLNNQRLEAVQLIALADLPSLDVLRGQIAALINTPATQLVRVLAAPGQQVARALQARVDKESQAPASEISS